ncbi:MAG: DUF2232 domain-containing protein [Clostridia bacterium]|nr:DUF2232 domain-containing protein [Clostridia bacterium]
MNRATNLKFIYPVVGSALALCGTAALCLGLLGTWIAFLLGANIFIAAGLCCGTDVRTVRRKNPLAQISEDEPEELEGKMYRVPFLSVLAAVLAAIAVGIFFRSAILGLLTFFTWGGIGFPLAACVLSQTNFAGAMQTGLVSSVGVTALAGVIQVFLSSPNHSFNPQYCLEQLATRMKDAVTAAFAEIQKILAQPNALPDGADLSDLIAAAASEEGITAAVHSVLSITPGLFALAVLVLSFGIWWGMKVALKRVENVEIKYMNRIDGYRPSWLLSLVYLVFVLINVAFRQGSVLQIVSMNVVYVLSAVLTFAGFSLILYFINTRAPSPSARILLTVAAVVIGLSSCGSSLLLLLGLLSAGRDLRGMLGGGTYQ